MSIASRMEESASLMQSRTDCIARAEALMAAGFTSEAARKECMTYTISRAFDVTMEMIRNELLNQRDAGIRADDQSFRDLYYGTPAIANWKPKHAAMFEPVVDPQLVVMANALAEMRATAKAMPLIEKPKSKTRIAKDERAADAMTCQCCGRPILAETGVIAHHGYERPGDGYQTQSCLGARRLPFEADRTALRQMIDGVCRQITDTEQHALAIESEKAPVVVTYNTGRYNGRRPISETIKLTRANFVAMKAAHGRAFDITTTFDSIKTSRLASIAGEIRFLKQFVAEQEKRYAGWVQTHRWNNGWERV